VRSRIMMVDSERMQFKSSLVMEKASSSVAASCIPPFHGPRGILGGRWNGMTLGAAKAGVWKLWTTAGADMVASPYAVMALGADMRTKRCCAVALSASEIPELPDSPGFSEEAIKRIPTSVASRHQTTDGCVGPGGARPCSLRDTAGTLMVSLRIWVHCFSYWLSVFCSPWCRNIDTMGATTLLCGDA